MTWQDELRKLDEELAAGQLHADDYRRRRDELLAQANNPNTGGQPAQQPPQQEQQQGPFPPPFRWDAAPESTQMISPVTDTGQPAQAPGAEGADATQVVPGAGQATPFGSPDATQVVSPGQVQSQQPGDAERTQVVPGGMQMGQPMPGQQQAWPQQQQMAGGDPNAAPPWGGGDMPPTIDPGWMHQGPEVFEETSGGGKGGKIIAIVVAIVLVAGLGVGGYFLLAKKGGDQQQAQQGTSQGGGAGGQGGGSGGGSDSGGGGGTKPNGPLAADIPGEIQANPTGTVKKFADVEQSQLLGPEESTPLQQAGADQAGVVFSRDNGNGIIVLAVKVQDSDTAKQVATELHTVQIKNIGMKEKSTQSGVALATTDDAPPVGGENLPSLRRVHYSSNGWVVRIEVRGKDPSTTDDLLDDTLAKQLKKLPADAS